MNRPQFNIDTTTGTNDLAWGLVMIWFLFCLLSMRATSSIAGDAAADSDRVGTPAVLIAESIAPAEASDDEIIAMLRPSRVDDHHPSGDTSIWLADQCQRKEAIIQLQCPPQATHRDCQVLMGALLRRARGCRFQY